MGTPYDGYTCRNAYDRGPTQGKARFGKNRAPKCTCTGNSTCEECLKRAKPGHGYRP